MYHMQPSEIKRLTMGELFMYATAGRQSEAVTPGEQLARDMLREKGLWQDAK